jgi:PKHD-type hydroxylase
MENFYLRKVLDDEHVSIIQNLLKHADENNLWENGLMSGGGNSSIKRNRELIDHNMSQKINDFIMESLDSDKDFISYTVAKCSGLNIISKYESGDYYKPHMDNFNNGDYSTTLFLSDPSTYSGGELCLLLGNEEQMFKPEAGWAITYPTGTIHRVNTVLHGTRYASVFWTISLIKDLTFRKIYNQLQLIDKYFQENPVPIQFTDCNSSMRDPSFVVKNIQNELLRISNYNN